MIDLIVAASAVVTALLIAFTAWQVTGQHREARLAREAAVIKDLYDYVIRTHDDRNVIFQNRETILGIRSVPDLVDFQRDHPQVSKAIHAATNCYHYLGFHIDCGLITNPIPIYEEAAHTILSIADITMRYTDLEREKTGKKKYKQHFYSLVKRIRMYEKDNSN